ncbi:ABC transporter permease subunit [Paenibacillus sp. P25]|nr:ABC transporter permease subunit [Paenibacillus sp. P25]
MPSSKGPSRRLRTCRTLSRLSLSAGSLRISLLRTDSSTPWSACLPAKKLQESLLLQPEWFRTIFVSSGIWQTVGWGTIIYLATLTGIDPEQYDAAKIDGAGRWRQMTSITLPGIMPTVIIMLILQLGHLLNVGFEKVILLYSPTTYETADVISSYTYRVGLQDFNYSFSAAVGLFNSVINFCLVIFSNRLSRKLSDTSLW